MQKRKLIILILLCCGCLEAMAQFRVTAHQEGWEDVPPEAVKPGFGLQKQVLACMDDEPGMEAVLIFGHDNGHYPTFDLFKMYYCIIDHYSKKVKYMSDIYVNDAYDLKVEDRNQDGRSELYITYFKDGKFSTDERGYGLKTTRCYDRIEWMPEKKH